VYPKTLQKKLIEHFLVAPVGGTKKWQSASRFTSSKQSKEELYDFAESLRAITGTPSMFTLFPYRRKTISAAFCSDPHRDSATLLHRRRNRWDVIAIERNRSLPRGATMSWAAHWKFPPRKHSETLAPHFRTSRANRKMKTITEIISRDQPDDRRRSHRSLPREKNSRKLGITITRLGRGPLNRRRHRIRRRTHPLLRPHSSPHALKNKTVY
jgi:hypothetical protein